MKPVLILVAAVLALSPSLAGAHPQQSRQGHAHGRHALAYAYAQPRAAPARRSASSWRGPDPSYGPGTPAFRWYQSHGRCVIDEGYGRYSFCDEF
ncbi:MAG: hypothetical protein JOZ94_12870 [Xanthobacteraceae bacterium]|nr:hypothetical protein [Xanthobacteraceae bacterium]MBV9236721.1 hypothetical protein [Xanthobacteraceae bacterium]MBV9627016.1 hypothetical protein [Xanthobacteraceae bacterium]